MKNLRQMSTWIGLETIGIYFRQTWIYVHLYLIFAVIMNSDYVKYIVKVKKKNLFKVTKH